MSKVRQVHREQYQADGCVRIEGVFSSEWVERVRAGIDRLVATHEAGQTPQPVVDQSCQSPFFIDGANGTYRMLHVAAYSPEIQQWISDSPAAETLADVIGANSLRYWLDGTFDKTGDGPVTATPWHNDECSYPLTGEHSASLWMALTDVDEDNAPLLTLRGSNRDPWRYHSSFAPQDVTPPADFKPWSHLLGRVQAAGAPIQSWPAKAGDVLVIHPKTIHASAQRAAGKPGRRLAFSSRWIGDDIRYAPNPVAMAITGVKGSSPLVPGQPLPEDAFPVSWRR